MKIIDNENFRNYWRKEDKEDIINTYLDCVNDCECLFERIQEAKKYIEDIETFSGFRDYIAKLNIIKRILDGE